MVSDPYMTRMMVLRPYISAQVSAYMPRSDNKYIGPILMVLSMHHLVETMMSTNSGGGPYIIH